MRASAIGDSVEGHSLELQCRKFQLHGPQRSKLKEGLIFSFKLSIHGYARVSKMLPNLSERISEKSNANVGDEIHGETISGISSKAPGRQEVKHATGTHKATFVSTRGHSYAEVEIGVREQLQAAAEGKQDKVGQ